MASIPGMSSSQSGRKVQEMEETNANKKKSTHEFISSVQDRYLTLSDRLLRLARILDDVLILLTSNGKTIGQTRQNRLK